jgi:class 3 adenylate cyclase/tetratricopeptide (TPR) repeat protein
VSDVGAWLEGLGLGEYASAFREHKIDLEALPHLTEGMLEEIGLPSGPRAKVLAARSGLNSASTPHPESAKNRRAGDAPAQMRAMPRQAERRQMTVLLCDLADSTKLASDLDPEDFRSVMHAYQEAARGVMERYEGHVAQYRGDAIEVYFGWPVAHEDAAERAVRAGLEVVEAVKSVASLVPLSVRVGISTGIVVIGETGSGDPSKPSGAVGDTPHIAARLQALATRDSVVIAESTRRLISGRFDQIALGPQELKGIAERVPAFRVLHVREDSSRFQAAQASSLTPLVGRRTELAFLQQRWRDAKEGEGQVVYLSGVPGIGKSRIVHELWQGMVSEGHFDLRFQCLPHHAQSALFPVIQQIRSLADLAEGDSDQTKLEKIHRLLALGSEQPDKAAPLVAELLSIPIAPRYAPLELTPLQLKVQTLSVLVELLLGLSARAPVFCLLEDAQWIDPSTQELLDLLVDQVGKARILVIVTHRPEYRPRSGLLGNASALAMARLPRRDVVEMAQLVLREQAVSPAILQGIIDESDSLPLFVEELARGVIEASGIGKPTKLTLGADPSASWLVPASLRDSLMARLDRAPQARSVAQIAAVVGRDFSYEILLRVSSLSKTELDSTLAHLRQSEIVQRIDDQDATRYTFKHALLRDVAYESLLRSRRRELHARVGAVIESEWPEIVTDQPELLAYHYAAADNAELAVRYWVIGAQRARSRSANVEAIGQLENALEHLALLPETPARRRTELDIQLSLGLCSIALRGYSANDTRRAFERACSLSAQLGEPQKEIQATFGLWGHFWMRARHDQAIALAGSLLAKGERITDPIGLVVGHRSLGSTLFTLGKFVQAREHLERAISLARETTSTRLALTYAVDPRIAAQLMLAWDLWILGYPEQALENVLQALQQAQERGDPYSIAFAHYVTSAVRLLRGEAQDSLGHADQSIALSSEHRINLYALYSRFGRGCALATMGRKQEALVEIREGIEEAGRSNLGYMRVFMLGWLATVQAATGDPESALATIDDALRHIDDVSGRAWEAETLRLRGDAVLAARPDMPDEALRSYRDAIAVAQHQSARSLELRATTSLARRLLDQGRTGEARELLEPIYGWFTEGFGTADLHDARALLGRLK